MQGAEAVLGGLQGEGGAELRLPAGAFKEDDEVPSDAQGEAAAQVVLEQGQGQVNAGGDAGRGPEGAIPDVDRVWLDADGGVAAGEVGALEPVRCRSAVVEETGFGQQEGAGADGGDSAGVAGAGADPVDQGWVLGGSGYAGAAGNQQGVPFGLGWG